MRWPSGGMAELVWNVQLTLTFMVGAAMRGELLLKTRSILMPHSARNQHSSTTQDSPLRPHSDEELRVLSTMKLHCKPYNVIDTNIRGRQYAMLTCHCQYLQKFI